MRCYCGCGCNSHTRWIILAQKKPSFLGHCIAEIWHKLLLEFTANCTIIILYTKWEENFPASTSTTKCVNISVSTQPFFTKQGPFYSQLDNQSYDHTIMKLSDDIKISPESLVTCAMVQVVLRFDLTTITNPMGYTYLTTGCSCVPVTLNLDPRKIRSPRNRIFNKIRTHPSIIGPPPHHLRMRSES